MLGRKKMTWKVSVGMFLSQMKRMKRRRLERNRMKKRETTSRKGLQMMAMIQRKPSMKPRVPPLLPIMAMLWQWVVKSSPQTFSIMP